MKKSKHFKDFITKVRAIDTKAASYLNGRKILEDFPHFKYYHTTEHLNLILMFSWKRSPQGFKYWFAISNELHHRERLL